MGVWQFGPAGIDFSLRPRYGLILVGLRRGEDAVDKHPVTPGEVLPARELLADMLSQIGQFEEALQQYQGVLSGSRNRLNALIGAANAADRAGDSELAESYRAVIRKQTESRLLRFRGQVD